MAGVMYLGNQMVTPVIVKGGETNPLFPINNGVITKNVSNGINAVGVKEVDDFGLYSAFYTYGYSSSDEPWGYFVKGEVSFPDLEKVGHCGMKETFYGQYYITKVSMPKLKVIEESGLERAFFGNYSYRYALEVNLDSLEDIKTRGLDGAFEYHNLNYLMLPSLKPENFTNETDYQFSGMLYGVSNCTVYFSSAMQQAIGSWSVVTSGFSGTNTTVIFYIPTKITVNIEQENATILTSDKIFNGVIFATGSTAHYVVYDSSENKCYLGNETDCVEGGEPRTVNVDLTDYNYNKITLNINESDSSKVSASWNNISIPLTQESSTVYSVYVNSSIGENIIVSVGASSSHAAMTATVTTNGQDINETIVLPEYQDFVRPNLNSNGIIGGDSFAVACNDSDVNVYKAFDGDASTSWDKNSGNYILTIYNPKKIQCSLLSFTSVSSSNNISNIPAVFGDGVQLTGRYLEMYGETNYFLFSGDVPFCNKYQIAINSSNDFKITEIGITAKELT